MARDPRLSEEVEAYIDTLKSESDRGKSPEQRREDLTLRKMVEIMIDDIVKSRETIGDSRLKELEKIVQMAPGLIEDLVDDRFTVQAVGDVCSSVKRLMRLSRLEAVRIPSDVTNSYLREQRAGMPMPRAFVARRMSADHGDGKINFCQAFTFFGDH